VADTLQEASQKRTGWLQFEKLEKGFLPDELALQFNIQGRQFVTFVPANYVDETRNALVVMVIGTLEDGNYLVELPRETTAGGSKLRIPEGMLLEG